MAEACVALGRYPTWDLDRELFLRLTRVGEQGLKLHHKAAFAGLRQSAGRATAAAKLLEAKLSAATARGQKRADKEEQAALKKRHQMHEKQRLVSDVYTEVLHLEHCPSQIGDAALNKRLRRAEKRGLPGWQAESLSRFPAASAKAMNDLVDEIIASMNLPTRQSNRSLYDRLTKSRKANKLTSEHKELLLERRRAVSRASGRRGSPGRAWSFR